MHASTPHTFTRACAPHYSPHQPRHRPATTLPNHHPTHHHPPSISLVEVLDDDGVGWRANDHSYGSMRKKFAFEEDQGASKDEIFNKLLKIGELGLIK